MSPATQQILSDFLSREADRIWSACGAVRQLRDREELKALAKEMPAIKKATKGVKLGGMLRPNSLQLDHAFRILKFAAGSDECLCQLFATDDAYDPNREAANGHVSIEQTVYTPDKWLDYYVCKCAACGRVYRVEEREYHYTWWQWREI